MDYKQFIPYQISALSLKISKGLAKHYRDRFDISVSEWRVLVILNSHPNITAKAIADHTQMDKVRISRTLKILAQKFYIKQMSHPEDARAVINRLSDDGQSLMQAVIPDAVKYEQSLLKQLTTIERQQLRQLIAKFNQILD
ncbi:MarR family winged helix-turn-helix transcriptional regulator [Marinicella gelatinilytica]|uniref:MarR family winged helix-turn-helix transcriptional regulator n=1 Tax=Marinicella gelatinilytica TaxID=2996017 RepID=UPI0022608D53|nr:MarR family transcriptional regulator [Marinicella gelatinilytica]MCX7544373.1 MarR family transcriptional regulator [Marinicella gelatinilytica]